MTEIGIGVVGFGWMGQAHSRAYRDIPVYFQDAGVEPRLVAVADNVPARLELARDTFGFASSTTDWRELIARDDVDVVDVTAPNALHREIVEAAAAAGKHIACEKPVGVDPDATAAIERAGRRAGVITGCGYNYRWAPLVQYTRQLLDEGASASSPTTAVGSSRCTDEIGSDCCPGGSSRRKLATASSAT